MFLLSAKALFLMFFINIYYVFNRLRRSFLDYKNEKDNVLINIITKLKFFIKFFINLIYTIQLITLL